MKIKYIKVIGVVTLMTAFSLVSCSDNFLEEKKDYNGLNEQVFIEPGFAKQYVDYIYYSFLPGHNAVAYTWDFTTGGNDQWTKTTDEMAGETNWNKVWAQITTTDAHCLKYIGNKLGTSVTNDTWTRLRQINLFLDNIDKHGMAEADKNPLKGQMYFWRAYQYFEMVKLYGGVPLVLTAQNPIVSEADAAAIPRSSTSACIEQIVSDLDKAKELLSGTTWGGDDWGRITSGAAAAFKGRVLLTWASPLFNPNDDVTRWQRAYDANLEAKTLLETKEGKALFVAGGTANGKAWGDMWFKEKDNPEAVIVFGFNNLIDTGVQKNNGWEHACRSKAAGGSGAISPTKQMVDAFPMADGKSIVGNSSYNPVLFYKNRDPRFYKTFAYNGVAWSYAENTSFKQWTYSWYATSSATVPSKFTETAGANSSGIYLSKATVTGASSKPAGYQYSGTDYMEMRFAEVVLNLAECAIGISKLDDGKTLIRSIRIRAGILKGTSSEDYGLENVSTRDQHFAAVLNERKIEFAYENKRFNDLRRWKLFDAASGTTTRLGVAPLNGTRRTGYYIVAKKTDGTKYVHASTDPFIANTAGVAPIVNREPVFPYTIPATGKNPGTVIADHTAYLDYLYTNYFDIVERDNLDPTTNNWKFTWYPQYYYFGIYQTLMDAAPYLQQTQGWGGTFDPLK